jgi:flagellar protein FlgJ
MQPTTVPASFDVQGLADLRRQAAHDDPAAMAEAAVQFEALFIGMMLKTAREASVGEGIFDSSSSMQYLELMDQQVALDIARRGGFGIGQMLLDQLGAPAGSELETDPGAALQSLQQALSARSASVDSALLAVRARVAAATRVDKIAAPPEPAPPAASPEQFVARFLPEATTAARRLGVEPKLLLAQAALETGWGAALPRHPDGAPTHNLFGIKAGSSWHGQSAAHWTIENSGGVAERKREQFRAYGTSAESFADYVELISSSPRYAAALEHAHDAERYARALSDAGYATDPEYADKWLAIYRGERLSGALDGLKHSDFGPTQWAPQDE